MDQQQELNACAECGFSTRDLALFTRHIEKHENGGAASRKSSKAATNAAEEATFAASREESNGVSADHFQHLIDLAFSTTSPNKNDDNGQPFGSTRSSVTPHEHNPSHEDEMIFGHLANLGRFLSASQQNGEECSRSVSPMDLSEKRRKIEANNNETEGEDARHRNGEQKLSENKRSKNGGCGGSGKTTHKCPYCTFTTYMSQHMKSHLRAHENFIGQMYVCDVCGMEFSQKANMHRHRGTHSGVKPYECRFCQKRFFRKDQMQEHSMTHIKAGDDFDCPVAGCECKFSQHSVLRQHLDERHAISATQQAHCKRCTLQFANSRRLLLHYQTKHDEYYSAYSPYQEGQTPVKRLNGNLSDNGGGCGLSPSSSSAPISSTEPKRKSRKRQRRNAKESKGKEAANGQIQTDQSNGHQQQQCSASSTTSCGISGGGYNVEELLRLDCGDAITNHSSSPNTNLFRMQTSSPASAGFDLFRDRLLRTSSQAAALFAQLNPAAVSIPAPYKEPTTNQAAAAAAAHLFMQSMLMVPQQQQQQQQRQHLMIPTNSEGLCALDGQRKMKRRNSPKHHLPLAKSPDCKSLVKKGILCLLPVLNGYNKTTNAEGEENGEKATKIVQPKATATSATTPVPPSPLAVRHNENEEENGDLADGSESEGGNTAVGEGGTTATLTENVKREKAEEEEKAGGMQERCNNGEKQQKSKEESSANVANPPPPSRSLPPPPNSAHSSTTHSPSSSSSSLSSSNAAIGGVESSVSSAAGKNSTENSPLKTLNSKLFSLMGSTDGLLLRGLDPASAGEMDCAHCGLLFSDQTLYLLHKGLHSEADPWRCNLCGQSCSDKYTFTTHMISSDHS